MIDGLTMCYISYFAPICVIEVDEKDDKMKEQEIIKQSMICKINLEYISWYSIQKSLD